MKKTVQKQFGQFFTDPLIARLMVRWALKKNAKNFLDPAVGPGIFPQMANELGAKVKKTVVEYEPSMMSGLNLCTRLKAMTGRLPFTTTVLSLISRKSILSTDDGFSVAE